jgi:hypothetical protein
MTKCKDDAQPAPAPLQESDIRFYRPNISTANLDQEFRKYFYLIDGFTFQVYSIDLINCFPKVTSREITPHSNGNPFNTDTITIVN